MSLIITEEISLCDFRFWSGGKDTAESLSDKDFDNLEFLIPEIFNGGPISSGELNDLFWYDRNLIARHLGYENWDQLEYIRNIADYLYEYDVIYTDYYDGECVELLDEDDLKNHDGDNTSDDGDIFVLCKNGLALCEFDDLNSLSWYLRKIDTEME